jgi:hypothetical protein
MDSKLSDENRKSLDDGSDDGDISEFFVHGGSQSKGEKKKTLPKWLDHFNAKDLKILIKCSVAVWIMTIFMFIDATLRIQGQAAFFGWYVLQHKIVEPCLILTRTQHRSPLSPAIRSSACSNSWGLYCHHRSPVRLGMGCSNHESSTYNAPSC